MNDQLVQGIYFQKGLPIEIIRIILKYLEQPQDPVLLADICSFSKTMTIVTNIYYDKWIVKRQFKEGEDINWLENHLILYANEYTATNIGMQPKFKEILGRFCNVKKASQYIFNNYAYSNNLTAKTRANMLWGLFTVAERDEFIQSCHH
jgi:hypothetical protein